MRGHCQSGNFYRFELFKVIFSRSWTQPQLPGPRKRPCDFSMTCPMKSAKLPIWSFLFYYFLFSIFQVECVRQMHNNESFREAAEESSRDFCQLIEGWVRARSYSSYTPTWAKSNSTRRWERKRARPLFFSQKGALFFCGSSFEKSDFNTLSNFRFELVQSCSNMVKIY